MPTIMNIYRIYYAGQPQLGDSRSLLDVAFPQYTEETLAGRAEQEGLGYFVKVYFEKPQTPASGLPLTIIVERWDDHTQTWVKL